MKLFDVPGALRMADEPNKPSEYYFECLVLNHVVANPFPLPNTKYLAKRALF